MYYSWFSKQVQENNYLNDNIQRIVYGFAHNPVFTVADLQAENGNFAGGHYISLPDFSEEVIHTLQQIVDGTPARDIQPHNGGEPQTYLNYRHLKLHNTDSNLYPRNAVYYQRPPSFYEQNKLAIICIIALACAIVIILVMRLRFYWQVQQEIREREKAEEEHNHRISMLTPGSVVEGTVESLMPYGAFVNIGNGLSGLVHISQISTRRIKNPKEVLQTGQKVKAKILNTNDNKISLSMRVLEEEMIDTEAEEASKSVEAYSSHESASTSLGSLLANIKLDN